MTQLKDLSPLDVSRAVEHYILNASPLTVAILLVLLSQIVHNRRMLRRYETRRAQLMRGRR